ncbi:MAG: DNA-processing protein DprA [bacterium]|nr:DNA-processing protein DprA [bacterium]
MNYSVALAHFPKITYSRYRQLVNGFGDLSRVWQAEWGDLVKIGWEENIAHEWLVWKKDNPLALIFSALEEEEIRGISIDDPHYPALLAQINDPPFVLFMRGHLPPTPGHSLAVVGTRRCTAYGRTMCEKIVTGVVKQGITIVSGLALGIDGAAHAATLKNNGITLAVLGSGIDRQNVYPAAHKFLGESIIQNGGALLSEYPPGFLPTKYSFPARNRIIAGLSHGTLVVEAPVASGALITARCALDYNRDVLAIPHPATSILGEGCNKLLKMGAKLVTDYEDVLEAFNLQAVAFASTPIVVELDPAEKSIFTTITEEPKHIDQIIRETGLASGIINGKLAVLELRGLVKNLGNMTFFRNR